MSYLAEPKLFDIFKTILSCDVVDNHDGMCSLVVGSGDSSKSFLASRVPNL